MTPVPLDVDVASLPSTFPTPFRQGRPHPVAARAAEQLQAHLREALPPDVVRGPLGGKMFGVLVVLDEVGTPSVLWGFAGMIRGSRSWPGFVPPACDQKAFDALWRSEGARVEAFNDVIATAVGDHREQLIAEQQACSQALLPKLQATYALRNAIGETRSLEALFAPRPIPGGAGDCAAVKLLQHAYRLGLRPVALAEFWWGDPTPAGGRHHGVFYPACRGKCAKILPFMLEGIDCEPPPAYGNHGVLGDAPLTVFEDDDLWIVDKPSGLLSVPGRGNAMRDCVQQRLQTRAALDDSSWPRLVHRLDQATSGLLIAAKHKAAYVLIQQQFSRRTIDKRYEALVQGHVEGEGLIDLPLRPDIDDRPRQMHDPIHGKPAVTRWRALSVEGDHTRVAFWPQTGRSHQLRLHAAHPRGLGAPIVGDPLYGLPDEAPRLMLHAAGLRMVHPTSSDALELEAPVPF
ncbi:MAG: RluA family pseudouridine synthase [Nannocystaceae bacterium]|nr:RluA family pseudouridine synthase [bacterium]